MFEYLRLVFLMAKFPNKKPILQSHRRLQPVFQTFIFCMSTQSDLQDFLKMKIRISPFSQNGLLNIGVGSGKAICQTVLLTLISQFKTTGIKSIFYSYVNDNILQTSFLLHMNIIWQILSSIFTMMIVPRVKLEESEA